jgi:hypothetical protein
MCFVICFIHHVYMIEWLRYQKLISLETQAGITSHINKWANTDTRTYHRWDQVLRSSKHFLSTGHTHCEPSFIIMNAELSAVKVNVPSTVQRQVTQSNKHVNAWITHQKLCVLVCSENWLFWLICATKSHKWIAQKYRNIMHKSLTNHALQRKCT